MNARFAPILYPVNQAQKLAAGPNPKGYAAHDCTASAPVAGGGSIFVFADGSVLKIAADGTCAASDDSRG